MEQHSQFARTVLILALMGGAIGGVFGLISGVDDALYKPSEEPPSKPKRFVVIERVGLLDFNVIHMRDNQSGKEYLCSRTGGIIEVEPTTVEPTTVEPTKPQ